jgi:hypothetical protein
MGSIIEPGPKVLAEFDESLWVEAIDNMRVEDQENAVFISKGGTRLDHEI